MLTQSEIDDALSDVAEYGLNKSDFDFRDVDDNIVVSFKGKNKKIYSSNHGFASAWVQLFWQDLASGAFKG